MVRLTCLLRRKEGLTPAEFHAHWREVHGPLIAASQSGGHVVRYEQHPRPLDDYDGDDDPGFRRRDGAVVREHGRATGPTWRSRTSRTSGTTSSSFLDTDRLHFVVTEHPRLVMGDEAASFPLA